jgi:hypothetical protein
MHFYVLFGVFTSNNRLGKKLTKKCDKKALKMPNWEPRNQWIKFHFKSRINGLQFSPIKSVIKINLIHIKFAIRMEWSWDEKVECQIKCSFWIG